MEEKKLGPTGEFPQGRISPRDEGEIAVGFASANGKVIINFGTPVQWIGFDSAKAREFALMLLHHADKAEAGHADRTN